MKKYLMTGIAAVAMCAAFTSCSHEIDQVSQEDLNKMAAEKVVNDYNQAFIAAFGQPAANQDWGFGTTVTRTYNVEGNLWHDPAYYNLEYDAPVTTEEMNMVFNYVNNPTNVETVDQISFTQYWVAQIWNGKNDANADGVKAPESISYRDQNGATTSVVGGGQMDKLMIKETSSDDSWIHCNNFNAADNTDWDEGGEGGRTLMWSSGTYSFGYTNSDGSHFSTKYIIVPGAKIHSSLKDFYYVCFDFEKGYTAEEQAAERSYGTCEKWVPQDGNPNGGYWQGGENWDLPGFYNDASSAELKTLLETQKGTKVQNITFKGYLEGNHHFAGDGNYTDWIVRISPARVISSSDYDGRIMAEDLSATEASDFDFNDVVFDYKLLNDETAEIQLRAAGGTLELYVGGTRSDDWKTITGGYEVHERFDVSVNQMVNTGVTTVQEPDPFVVDCAGNLPVNIKIWVKKNGVFHELTAHTGEPASKFRTACTTKWCDEYISISNPYPTFKNWVNDTNFTEWTTTNFIEIFADKNLSNNEGAIKGRY